MADDKKLEQDISEFLKNRFKNPKIENVQEHINKLQFAQQQLSVSYEFKAGDILVWKKGLKNRARPAENEPIVVLEILETPTFDTEKGAGSAYFKEPLDLIAGLVDSDGDFIIFYFDKRRFEPYKES